MEFGVTTLQKTEFTNRELQTATNNIFKLGESIKNSWFKVAYIVSEIDAKGVYTDDGFETVHDWVTKTFGLKKTASYTLLKIGKEYTRKITNSFGKTIGYGSNLVEDGEPDFSKTQVECLLPLGHEVAREFADTGVIRPDMTCKDIKTFVKNYQNSNSPVETIREVDDEFPEEDTVEVTDNSPVETIREVDDEFPEEDAIEVTDNSPVEDTPEYDDKEISKLDEWVKAVYKNFYKTFVVDGKPLAYLETHDRIDGDTIDRFYVFKCELDNKADFTIMVNISR